MRSTTWLAIAFLLVLGSASYHDLFSFAATEMPTPTLNGGATTASQRDFFETKIRPVLVKNCFGCHSAQAKEIEGGLVMDSREGLRRGGENGPVIIPGNVDGSVLIQAIRYTNKDLQMPPDAQLSDATVHDFETWIKMGAPDPRDEETASNSKAYDTTEAKKWWSFQPLKRPQPAEVTDTDWPKGEIDKYVLSALEAKDLKPVADADKLQLIRRIYFDLIGLPPTPQQVDAFLNDTSPDAYVKTVDTLLASPQFGEHWGRHWLDVARYAESSGKDFNVTFPDAWRYRDYVIASFNADKPYDQFVREQLAGDLLTAPDMKTRVQQVIATGFLAIGPKGLDEMTQRQFDLDLADEQLDATSQAFIGLTVSCARCHDHKFDPIMQTDYYAMAGIFLSTKTDYGTVAGLRNNDPSQLMEVPPDGNLPVVQKDLTEDERQKLENRLADITTQMDDLKSGNQNSNNGTGRRARQNAQNSNGQNYQNNPNGQNGQNGANANGVPNVVQKAVQLRVLQGEKAMILNTLNLYDESGHPKAFCMGVQDRPVGPIPPMLPMQVGQVKPNLLKKIPSGFEVIADSPLFFRGEMSDPRQRVPRGIPAFLSWSNAESIPRNQSGRLELADWIVSPRNPLTARVMANRLWYWLYGQGIVNSVDNFGTMGDSPSNQQLLDYLATRLMENGWSIKKTIREIVLSHTYQLASSYDETDYAADPQNSLLWRHSQRRLNAECIRDAMLLSSGVLDLKPPVGSAVALAGDGAVGGPAYARVNEDTFTMATSNNRSVYLPIVRDEIPDSLQVFDYPDTTVVTGARETTNVPSQALYLLNSDFVKTQSRTLALRLFKEIPPGGNPRELRKQRINLAFRLTLGRPATEKEISESEQFFSHMTQDGQIGVRGMVDFCLALYNTAEFRYLN